MRSNETSEEASAWFVKGNWPESKTKGSDQNISTAFSCMCNLKEKKRGRRVIQVCIRIFIRAEFHQSSPNP